MILNQSNSEAITQENVFPWIAALIRKADSTDTYVNAKCGGTLVSFTSEIST